MTPQNWHSDFNPKNFLSHVNLDLLIEKNKAYNQNVIKNSKQFCSVCDKPNANGIVLNDKSFLCRPCYIEISAITYPEKYEKMHREYLAAPASREIARNNLKNKHEYIFTEKEKDKIYLYGVASIFLTYVNLFLFIVPIFLFAISFLRNKKINEENSAGKARLEIWKEIEAHWQKINPPPEAPKLKHFHDSTAELTKKDLKILTVFNHWPGYPPFWKYLRVVILARDSYRCQVSGCPSRLGLHIHHMRAISDGGTHEPTNLVSLCDFHHALEPDHGHEKIWENIRTRYFTLVNDHSRSNKGNEGVHSVRAHLRRLVLVTKQEIVTLSKFYGFCCPKCIKDDLKIEVFNEKNIIEVTCQSCDFLAYGPQQLTEETGPRLAEILCIKSCQGIWRPRWDMLTERKNSDWGGWHSQTISEKRKLHREKIESEKATPFCPKCASPMRLKKPWKPDHTWQPFWGCIKYDLTKCNGSVKYTS